MQVLPAVDGELSIFAAAQLDSDGETLAAWVNAIEQLKKSPYVLRVRRFSDPPVIEDLQELALDETDLTAVRECKPGSCDIKLAANDILSLRQVAAGPRWKEAVQEEFKRMVLNRVGAYHAGGFLALPAYADRRKPTDPRAMSELLLARSPYLTSAVIEGGVTESFFYWSKEQYGAGKPVVSVTHVDIVRPQTPSALRLVVISREIMATHYRNASLALTAITEDGTGRRYLVYVNRSQVDVLGGLFGAWKRSIVEGRLKSETGAVLNTVRRRLDSGLPPE